jgi:phosphoenolpyruvate-protein phosphotransferase (PTS system enzyme I)
LESNFKNSSKEQLTFSGKALNPGIAFGKAFILKNLDIQQLKKNRRTIVVFEAEIAKLDFAVKKTKDQLSLSIENAKKSKNNLMDSIFNAYLVISEDTTLLTSIKETIKKKSVNCESVLAEKIINLRESILKSTDDFKLKLVNTLQDLYYRILYNLVPSSEDRVALLRKIELNSVLISDRLTPIEVAVIPFDKVGGIVLEEEAKNSHALLMLQSFEVPIVINVPGIGSSVHDKDDLIIDGYEGCVILNPDEEIVKKYKKTGKRQLTASKNYKIQTVRPNFRTIDDFEVNLLCNASNLSDIQSAQRQGINEVGLFRSEMFFLSNSTHPTDESEKAFYKDILTVKGINNIFMRLYDIGGDKLPVFLHMSKETNPDLGCRGIRYLLSYPDIMKKQIRSILASYQAGKLHLILPFIATIDDVNTAREIIFTVFEEVGIPENSIKIGIMVEIPSVALSIEKFLPKVDFINLGTNDLIQYFFAVNRDQPELNRYNRFTHPAFIKMLKGIIMECEKQKKMVIACGEMSSHPLGSALLISLGVNHISVQPELISQIYKTLTNSKLADLQKSIPEIINFEKAEDVELKLRFLNFM